MLAVAEAILALLPTGSCDSPSADFADGRIAWARRPISRLRAKFVEREGRTADGSEGFRESGRFPDEPSGAAGSWT